MTIQTKVLLAIALLCVAAGCKKNADGTVSAPPAATSTTTTSSTTTTTAGPATAAPAAAAPAATTTTTTTTTTAAPDLKTVTAASGLKYQDVAVGTGPSPQAGDTVTVNYTGTLDDGTKFDSSIDRGTPFDFTIGVGQVIKGWDEGVMSMKVGGKRNLIIPSDLGYGATGAGGVIPPNATLHFYVELLGIKPKA
jgi:peptidylprolyl isomerase